MNTDRSRVVEEFIALAGEDWKERILEYLRKEEDDSGDSDDFEDTAREKFNELLDAIRESIMEEDESILQYIKDKFDNEVTIYNQLIKYVRETLLSFDQSRILRKCQEDRENWIRLTDDIYDNAILRYDPDFTERFAEYGLNDEEELKDSIWALEIFTGIAVDRAYTQKVLQELCWNLFRLEKDSCQYIAEKIEKNFRDIQMKRILDKLIKE